MAELAETVEARGEELLGETGSAADWRAHAAAARSPAELAMCLRRLEARICMFGDGLPRGALFNHTLWVFGYIAGCSCRCCWHSTQVTSYM